jgi:hypothetical protein
MAGKSFIASKVSSHPGQLALISYVILLALILLPIDLGAGVDDDAGFKKYTSGWLLVYVPLLLIFMGLQVYSINCMVVGNCFAWSWLNAILIAVSVGALLLSVVLRFVMPKAAEKK